MFVCRSESLAAVTTAVKEVIRLRQKFPDSIVGFDIVGWEDAGHPLRYFIDALLYPSQHGIKLPYFFHSSETGLVVVTFCSEIT